MGVVSVRLPDDLVEWIDQQPGNRTEVITRIIEEKKGEGGMKAIIYVDQVEALKAGKHSHGRQELFFNPANLSEEHRNELARSKDGKGFNASKCTVVDPNSGRYRQIPLTLQSEASIGSLQSLLDERIKHRRQAYEKLADLMIEGKDPYRLDRFIRDMVFSETAGAVADGEEIEISLSPMLALKKNDWNQLKMYCPDRFFEAEESCRKVIAARIKEEVENRKVRTANRKAENDKKAERNRIADSWLKEHGTETQAKRREAGYMPDDELENMIENWILKDVKEMPTGVKCDCGEIAKVDPLPMFTNKVECMTDEEFEVFMAFDIALPEEAHLLEKDLLIREYECACGERIKKPCIYIGVNWHEFEFWKYLEIG